MNRRLGERLTLVDHCATYEISKATKPVVVGIVGTAFGLTSRVLALPGMIFHDPNAADDKRPRR